MIAVAALVGARARWAVFALAAAGVVGSAAAAILMASDETVNRVYFGTDTRVQALRWAPPRPPCWCATGRC